MRITLQLPTPPSFFIIQICSDTLKGIHDTGLVLSASSLSGNINSRHAADQEAINGLLIIVRRLGGHTHAHTHTYTHPAGLEMR